MDKPEHVKYWLSTMPARTPLTTLVRLANPLAHRTRLPRTQTPPRIEIVFDHVVEAANVEDVTEQLEQFISSLNVEFGEPINRGYPHILLGRSPAPAHLHESALQEA